MTILCTVIGRNRHKMIQAEIEESARRGAQMIELRLDYLTKAPDFKRLLATKPCPMIATVRRQEDGGRWAGTEAARQMLIRQAVVAGFDWVDLELDVADIIGRFKNVKRIVSYHNLREMPDELEELYQRLCEKDADVVKIAVRAQRVTDNLRILKLMENPRVPTIALCLGDLGFPSRILAAKFGAPFVYAAFNIERTLSLGIPYFGEMRNTYFYEHINSDTQVYGVIGDPIGHSLSPLIHNTLMHKLGINGVYIPFRVPRGELAPFLKGFETIPVRGYSVTIPHKETALAMANQKDETATIVGAANTLVMLKDGFAAYNTDYEAFRESLLAGLAASADGAPAAAKLSGKAVLLLGAGGVARAAARVLQGEGSRITIVNRSAERAQDLAEDIGCRFVAWEARHNVMADLLVNCTPVGMHPHVDEMPVHTSYLRPELAVVDTVYTPENTLLVKEARARGCPVMTGVEMFIRQAALQFRLFTGQEAPLDLLRSIMKRALSPIALPEEGE
jgi:3-dehydroquinate dehydratase / shikimate dehydrogenase